MFDLLATFLLWRHPRRQHPSREAGSCFGPKSVITSIEYNWAPFYIRTTESVLNGTWKSADYWGGLADDALTMPITP
ncbi:hypothetical protein, partial [Qipengyuania sp.]|uniref:hypothetical protein n=1 Tax=Qipengyuania sp. TaxID=2004515 RepID=UPI003735DFD3